MKIPLFMKSILLLSTLLCLTVISTAQPRNLLQNPKADNGINHWKATGDAVTERTLNKGWHFKVRNNGFLRQDIALPANAEGQYVLLIGFVASERINEDGAITGLPYLYGYLMDSITPNGKILSYLQGQNLRCETRKANAWETVWGIFPVVEGATVIRFFLNQAEKQGVPQNGSAARFDDLGIYLFKTEKAATDFVRLYKAQER